MPTKSSTAALGGLLLLALLALSGCKREIVPEPYQPTSAHDAYRHGIREAGLLETALGRDWESAADAALRSPVEVSAPFEETFWVDRAVAFSAGYRFSVKRGQRTEVALEVVPVSDWRLFVDLFRVADEIGGASEHVATGAEGDLRLAFEPRRDGEYLLRVQSELLRGGSVTLSIRNVASLTFPVAGSDTSSIGSGFGAPREGGRRSHHGIDIFAPRHTEVLATSRARVRRVDEWKLGGRVIWLEDPERDIRVYFAHLETQDVTEGTWVGPGDRIGTVGNSGNARTTPPHLHFGIYVRGEGPLDPHPFLHQPKRGPDPIEVDLGPLGEWVRTKRRRVALVARPHRSGETPLAELGPGTPVRVGGGTGRSYRVSLPNGIVGYVPSGDVEPLDAPVDSFVLAGKASLRESVSRESPVIRELPAGSTIDVFGSFRGHLLVGARASRAEWLVAPEPQRSTPTAP